MEEKEVQRAWHTFELTGSVSDYLHYVHMARPEGIPAGEEQDHAAKNQGDRTQAEEYW